MGQQQSKEELLYQQVNYANIEGIKELHRQGANLEWVDREGKTPLIVACMNHELFNVAKTLIELGANVNAYRPGCHAGTPLHHAAKRGIEQTVKLLISYGANPLIMNDDCQTPLEVARAKGYSKVVRAIEGHLCFFAGYLRELYGPGFLEALAPQWVSRKIWAVVVPCVSRNPAKPLKLELAIYCGLQEAQPRTIVPLWKCKIEEVKINQPDPTIIIFDKSTKTRYKFVSANEGDKQQILMFYNACRGFSEVHPPLSPNTHTPVAPATAPPSTAEDVELAMAINASIQSAIQESAPVLPNTHVGPEVSSINGWGTSGDSSISVPTGEPAPPLKANNNESNTNSVDNSSQNGLSPTGGLAPPSKASSGWPDEPVNDASNGCAVSEAEPGSNQAQHNQAVHESSLVAPSIPSAPPISEIGTDDGPIHYPSIDCSPVDLSIPTADSGPSTTNEVKEDGGASSSCVICLDSPIEGACIPCGHMAGCMSCLNEIKEKKWGCPVCRATIEQVVRLYAVV
ncbi:PREDICTED: putative E3 ubiquitin-protein ligase XBAT34 [Nelumbo nucifera]|uniref:E3 ubiquitin-protein ligase XBAT34 n=1 Tax=Nelumbo nucifera TaxID=4432 RepID=A0A1U7Z187_NELNU|nr:PREDICTED: putative E3 ubiquitin-protein ligase XBAT34 [Nelumbo nucifera]